MDIAYQKLPEDLAKELNSNLTSGLSIAEAQNKFNQYGPNTLKEAKSKNPLLMFLSEFTDFLVIILIVASLISYFLGEKFDAGIIISIVVINAVVGFIQEYRVEKAIQHLKKLVTSNCLVTRDGNLVQIASHELVPGDLITLEEGQKVPADIRLISTINLQTIEASLTGESTPITKHIEILSGELPIADQRNMAFSGTVVSSGKAVGLVISTGMSTQLGHIANMVQTQEDPETPMQQKLDHLGALIGKIVLGIAAVVALEEFFLDSVATETLIENLINASISAVALAVAAIPEGLPAVVTISLALGTKRLLKQNALIRNLPAAETLGSTDVICTDKTGTLTEGVMSVRQIYLSNKVIELSEGLKTSPELQKILEMGILSSNARIGAEGKVVGDSTEAALILAATKFGIDQNKLLADNPRALEVPFSSQRKMMTTASKNNGQMYVTSKGAAEMILSHCSQIEIDGAVRSLTDQDKQTILKTNDDMAGQALRVLAFAYKINPSADEKTAETDLIFLGLQGMMDPPRKDIKESITICQQQAGIKVVMITGDHLLTARAVAREIGIEDRYITGGDLDKLSDADFETQVETLTIYARVNPEHKLRIVKALQKHGHQVAMTGDGVNDAPALKAADIGVAMGITGTDVAKDSSDMILLDDHFNTIVAAVREGRGIYDNIRKFVNYLLSSNMMEVAVIFIAVTAQWPIPLLPIHLLWINLVTDGLPAIALGVDPTRANIMTLAPKNFKEEIITPKFFKSMAISALILTVAILGIYYFSQDSIIHAQTIAFTAVVLYEMIRILSIRAEYNLSIFSNKYLVLAIATSIILQLVLLYAPISVFGSSLQTLFKIQPLNLYDWGILLTVGVAIFFAMKLSTNKPVPIPQNNTQKGFSVLVLLPILALLLLGGSYYLISQKGILPPNNQQACTLEAMICPDGSSVGRTGPNCEFTACPNKISTSTSGWNTYANTDLGYTIKYPPSYTAILLDPVPYQDINGKQGTLYQVSISDGGEGTIPNDIRVYVYTKDLVPTLQTSETAAEVTVAGQKVTQTTGLAGHIIGVGPLKHNQYVYAFNYFKKDSDSSSQDFYDMLSSFKFTDQTPTPSCMPRPKCLDSTPRCLIPEPSEGWCKPTPFE